MQKGISMASSRLHRYEFHFQEGFNGQEYDILCAGSVRATVIAHTRTQIGLAHIEGLELEYEQEARIRDRSTRVETPITLHHETPFITLNLIDGVLEVVALSQSPGYV